MQIIQTVSELRKALANQPSIGFVPTMGNLHAGHIALVTQAKQHAAHILKSCVVASIFVNPLQFSPTEDLANYPRTLEADCEKLKAAGCDIVFTPSVADIYPQMIKDKSDGKSLGQTMTIDPPPIANVLCGATRLSHFAGVATVVMKLFNIVQPQFAVFGKKDFQQLFIIREMVKQFNLPIEIIAGETIREANGLALSSRNGYLTDAQRVAASQLNSALQSIIVAIKSGKNEYVKLEKQATEQLTKQGWEVDYVSIRSSTTLQTASQTDQDLIVLGAAKIINKTGGKTRLIDNIELRITD